MGNRGMSHVEICFAGAWDLWQKRERSESGSTKRAPHTFLKNCLLVVVLHPRASIPSGYGGCIKLCWGYHLKNNNLA